MSGWGYGWRRALMAWMALSAVVWVVGLVLTQFDSQYDESGAAGRLVIGGLAGLFAVVIYSPVTLVVAIVFGLVGGIAHRRRGAATQG